MSNLEVAAAKNDHSGMRTIAVDMDDVLSQTNLAVAQWHNQVYGTSMTLDDFHYYHYWKNPLWGNPQEAMRKAKDFFKDGLMKPIPVPGAVEGVKALKELGFRLVIVTARHGNELLITREWLDEYFPGAFDDILCTGQFQEDIDEVKVIKKSTKPDVCHSINALFLIDDSAENAMACSHADPPVPVLLFGEYEWNKRLSVIHTATDNLSHDERLEMEGGKEWWKEEVVQFSSTVTRIKDWEGVLQWVKENYP